jgi:hypothetical protein
MRGDARYCLERKVRKPRCDTDQRQQQWLGCHFDNLLRQVVHKQHKSSQQAALFVQASVRRPTLAYNAEVVQRFERLQAHLEILQNL